MTQFLACPTCGCTRFEQNRTNSYDETYVVAFSPNGEIEDERIEDQEHSGEESPGACRCTGCGWALVDENGEPLDEPAEIVAKFERHCWSPHAPTLEKLPGGEAMNIECDIDAATLKQMRSCDHKWEVYIQDEKNLLLLLECVGCGAIASVNVTLHGVKGRKSRDC